jgi:hypothetical protein
MKTDYFLIVLSVFLEVSKNLRAWAQAHCTVASSLTPRQTLQRTAEC